MTELEIKELLDVQRAYYKSGATLDVNFRINKLKVLYSVIKKYEDEITRALSTDLGKSAFQGFMCEVGLVLSEISYMMKNTRN